MIRALLHKLMHRGDPEHRVWTEVLHWSGERTGNGVGRVWFCTCGQQYWPVTKAGPYVNWRDNPVKRQPPN